MNRRPVLYLDLFHGRTHDFDLEGLIPGALYGRARQFVRHLTEAEAEQLPDPRYLPIAHLPKRALTDLTRNTLTIETRDARYLLSSDGRFSRLAPRLEPCKCVIRCADPLTCQAWYFCRMCRKWRIAAAGGCKCQGSEPAPWRRDPLTGQLLSDWRDAAGELRGPDPTSENSEK